MYDDSPRDELQEPPFMWREPREEPVHVQVRQHAARLGIAVGREYAVAAGFYAGRTGTVEALKRLDLINQVAMRFADGTGGLVPFGDLAR